jgi:hypothetical protein
LNDVFGFKPDQIEFKKLNQSPPLPGPSGPSNPPPNNPPNKTPKPNDKDEEIRQLKAQIKVLEEKLRQNPNSPNAQADRTTLNNLKKELKQKENSQQPSKDQFPYLLVFGGGGIVILVILVAAFLIGRSRREKETS